MTYLEKGRFSAMLDQSLDVLSMLFETLNAGLNLFQSPYTRETTTSELYFIEQVSKHLSCLLKINYLSKYLNSIFITIPKTTTSSIQKNFNAAANIE